MDPQESQVVLFWWVVAAREDAGARFGTVSELTKAWQGTYICPSTTILSACSYDARLEELDFRHSRAGQVHRILHLTPRVVGSLVLLSSIHHVPLTMPLSLPNDALRSAPRSCSSLSTVFHDYCVYPATQVKTSPQPCCRSPLLPSFQKTRESSNSPSIFNSIQRRAMRSALS